MATSNYNESVSLEAGADLTGNIDCLATINASGQVIVCPAGDAPIGVISHVDGDNEDNTTGSAGNAVTLQRGILIRAKVGVGGVTRGGDVMLGTTGRIIDATGTGVRIGKALTDGLEDEIVSVLTFMGSGDDA